MLGRWGARWRIRDLADWASLPALLLLFSIFSFLTEPLINVYSRSQEHQADVYGLEVVHGIVPDARAVATHSFQVLGEVDLDEPNPNKFIEFWMYSHPVHLRADRVHGKLRPLVERYPTICQVIGVAEGGRLRLSPEGLRGQNTVASGWWVPFSFSWRR